METESKSKKENQIILVFSVLCALYLFTFWYSMTENRFGANMIYLLYLVLSLFVGLCFFSLLVVVVGVAVLSVAMLLRLEARKWSQIIEVSRLFAICASLLVVTLVFRAGIENSGLRALAVRGGPLVNGIQRYQSANEIPPQALENLVPKYISGIPATDEMGYPKFSYLRNQNPAHFAGNPWVLAVPISNHLTCQYFVYYPNQRYPESGVGNKRVKKFGSWASIEMDTSEARLNGFSALSDE